MVLYEVNITLEKEIYNEYLVFLKSHIQELCALSGFQYAKIFKVDDKNNNDNPKLVVHYYIDHPDNLTNYLTRHASAMRQEAISRFKDKFTIIRRVLLAQDDSHE